MRRLIDTKAFFAIIQFKYKKSGEPWTEAEIQEGLNQKRIPGYDWYFGPRERQIINHEKCLDKLYGMITTGSAYGNFIKAQIRSCYNLPSGEDKLIAEWIHDKFQLNPKDRKGNSVPRFKPSFVNGRKPDDIVISHFMEIKLNSSVKIPELNGESQEAVIKQKVDELVSKYSVNV